DDDDLGRERRERPASGEVDVEADEDEKDRPEARDSEPGHSGDEAHGLEQKEQTEGDQKERPENASTAARVPDRTRCSRQGTPMPMGTGGHNNCHWTKRNIPALLKRNRTRKQM